MSHLMKDYKHLADKEVVPYFASTQRLVDRTKIAMRRFEVRIRRMTGEASAAKLRARTRARIKWDNYGAMLHRHISVKD